MILSIGIALASAGCASAPDSASSTSTPIERGAVYVQQRSCEACHGAGLEGMDAPQPGTKAYGPNLTPDMDTGIGSWTDAQIGAAIRTGDDDQGQSLCTVMPRFKDMTDDEAAAIVAYLRSLHPVSHESPESECAASGS